MKHLSKCIAVCLFLAAYLPAGAQESPATWAAKLGSHSYADRERAARVLERLGKPALTALRDAMATSDLETKRRAILLMERIEDRLMQEELVAAAPVHLQCQNLPINKALRGIEKQMGVRCVGVHSNEVISLDTGVLPYWKAWRKFCAAAKFQETDYSRAAARLKRLSEDDQQSLLSVFNRNELTAPRYFGPARIVFAAVPTINSFSVDDRYSVRVRVKWQALDRSIDAKTPHAVFAVEVRAEPRLAITSLPTVEITKMVDDLGWVREVQPVRLFPATTSGQGASLLAAYAGEIQYGGLLHLKAIAWQGPARSLKELHGRVRMEVTVRPRMIEIPRVLEAVGKRVGGVHGVTLEVLEAEATSDGEIRLRLRLDHLESLTPTTPEQKILRVRPGVIVERGVMDVALERLELIDGMGRRCEILKSSYEQSVNGKGYEAELLFATTGAKAADLMLALTKAPRTVAVDWPFLVRDVVWGQKKN